MTNQDRNIRTLVTCFVIALVALVPLRIAESQILMSQDAMVLGEETYNDEEHFYLDDTYVEEEEIYGEEVFSDEETYNEEEFYVGKMILGEETELTEEEVIEEEIVLPNAE